MDDLRLEEMDKIELQRRTKQFALRVFALCEALPRTVSGKVVVAQLSRSASSVGANYRAACRARSKAEFHSKISIVVEESDESAYWIELALEGKMLPKSRIKSLLDEANELTAIFSATRKSLGR